MKEMLRLILTLSIICVLSGALLAVVDEVTRAPITSANRENKFTALQEVLPPCDNAPDTNTCIVEHCGKEWTFYVARKHDTFAGAAVKTTTSAGYGGDIALMLGINADGTTEGIAILAQKETPGLGANIEGKDFKRKFVQKSLTDTQWAVKKDGGQIDQITAATISSRAVVSAVDNAIDAYLAKVDTIKETGR